MATIQENVRTLITQIQAGNVLGVFEDLYDESVVMQEATGEVRTGKTVNRQHEQGFVAAVAQWHKADVLSVNVNEEAQTSAVEWAFEMTFAGADAPAQLNQTAVQYWKNGWIIEEKFYGQQNQD